MGRNTWIHGSNVRNLCIAILNSTSKNALSYYAYVFSSTKLEIRAEQVLSGSDGGGGGGGERMREVGWGEK
jgi:hypothetical protein